MRMRVVAIPLIAAICYGSPAMASPTTEEQMVRGRGARDRNGGGGARAAGGGERRSGGGDRTSERRGNDSRRDNDRRDNDRSPRVVVRNRPDVHINFGSPYRRGYNYYTPLHYDRWARSYYRWSPVSYLPLPLIYGSIGFSNFGVYGGNYAYGSPWRTSGYDVGSVRLKIRPRDAQVFVDGYYAGLVDDFDGTFQSLRLEAGGHKIEIRMPGFQDMELDVHVQPGRTITLAEVMQLRP